MAQHLNFLIQLCHMNQSLICYCCFCFPCQQIIFCGSINQNKGDLDWRTGNGKAVFCTNKTLRTSGNRYVHSLRPIQGIKKRTNKRLLQLCVYIFSVTVCLPVFEAMSHAYSWLYTAQSLAVGYSDCGFMCTVNAYTS